MTPQLAFRIVSSFICKLISFSHVSSRFAKKNRRTRSVWRRPSMWSRASPSPLPTPSFSSSFSSTTKRSLNAAYAPPLFRPLTRTNCLLRFCLTASRACLTLNSPIFSMSVNIRTNCDYYRKVIVFKLAVRNEKQTSLFAAYDIKVLMHNVLKWWSSENVFSLSTSSKVGDDVITLFGLNLVLI